MPEGGEGGRKWLPTCTIVTTAANSDLAGIHDRMPVILSPADYDTWLDPSSKPAQLTAMLVPYAGNELQVKGASASAQ